MESALSMKLSSLRMPVPRAAFALGYLRLLGRQMRPGKCVQLGCVTSDFLKAMGEGFKKDIELLALEDRRISPSVVRPNTTDCLNLRAEYCDLTHLPLETQSIQCVTSFETIHQYAHESVWEEIWRVLRSGGHFVVTDLYLVEDWNLGGRTSHTENLVTHREYLDSLERLGFCDIRVLEEMESFDLDGCEVAMFTITGMKP